MNEQQLTQCEAAIQVTFSDKALLATALTHKSFSKQKSTRHVPHNERLEFLGDAILKLIVSEYLFKRFPEADEGVLTKLRAKLISDQFLGQLGIGLALGEYMRFSYGEEQSGGRTRPSNLANALEALLGACYLDQGFDCARTLYLRVILPFADQLIERNVDHKSTLQEWLQHHRLPLPEYERLEEVGPDHEKEFVVRVHVRLPKNPLTFEGRGASKKISEQAAAERAMAALLESPPL